MAGDTMTTLQKAFKPHYGERMAKSILSNVYMFGIMEDMTKYVARGGRDFTMIWPIQNRYAWGTAAGTAGGDFGTPDSTGIDEWQAGVVRLNASLQIDSDTINAADRLPDLSYIEKPVNFEMNQVKTVSRLVLGWQIFGDGSGAIAQVDTAQGAIQSDYFYVDNPGPTWLHEGMLIQAYDNKTTGGTKQLTANTSAFQRISKLVRQSNGTVRVYITDTTGLSDNDYIYQKGHYGIAALTGLSAIVDDGTLAATFQGATRSSSQWANAHVFNAGGASINESVIFPVLAWLTKRSPSKRITHIITDPDTVNWLALSLLDRQRFQGQDLKGGYKEVKYQTPFGEVTIVGDPLCPEGKMFFLDAKELGLGWGTAKGGEWYDQDGSPLKPLVSSSSGTGYADAWVATWRMILQATCNVPQNFALLYNYDSP